MQGIILRPKYDALDERTTRARSWRCTLPYLSFFLIARDASPGLRVYVKWTSMYENVEVD